MHSSKKRLLLFPQDKGGIGKSFVASLIHDYLTDQRVLVKAFDLDHANSTFNRLVPEAEFVDTDVDADKLGELDRLVQALADADTVLVDSRATGGSKLLAYLDEARVAELQPELDCRVVFVLVATDDKDANSQVAEVIEAWGDRVAWLVARNLRDGEALPLWGGSNSRRRLREELGAIEIDVPCLAEITRNRLQGANLTVGRGRTSDRLHLLDRSRCLRFHERMTGQFERARNLLIG
ncbi:MAG: hypothetical protein KF715_19560 [Candidatus Didemnitutus sp.]|nr:hypothetical protein [Candidatus Didemnitutus sp.]